MQVGLWKDRSAFKLRQSFVPRESCSFRGVLSCGLRPSELFELDFGFFELVLECFNGGDEVGYKFIFFENNGVFDCKLLAQTF